MLPIGLALLMSGCSIGTQSYRPFYRDGEPIRVPEVTGEWSRQDGHNPPYPRRWGFIENVSSNDLPPSYRLSVVDSRWLPSGYQVVFFQRGEKLYANFHGTYLNFLDSQNSGSLRHSLWSVEVKETSLTLTPWYGNLEKLPTTGSITNGFSRDTSVILTDRRLIPTVNFSSKATPDF
jgi:hypothetical protein